MSTVTPPSKLRQGAVSLLTEHELTIYLEYDYLTPDQLAAILSSVAGVHRAVMMTALQLEVSAAAILCVTHVSTFESIKIKYGGAIRVKREGDDTNVYLPNWSRSLIEVGELLLFVAALGTAVQFYFPKLADQQKTKRSTEVTVPYDTRRLSRDTDPAGHESRDHALLFHQYINAPNIRAVQINGIEIRRRDDDDENSQSGKPVQT